VICSLDTTSGIALEVLREKKQKKTELRQRRYGIGLAIASELFFSNLKEMVEIR